MADFSYQVTGFAYQGDGQFVYQGASGVPAPTVFYQGDGKKRRRRLKRERHIVYALFDNIEKTLREKVLGVEPSISPSTTLHTEEAVKIDVSRGLDKAIDQLVLLAKEQRDLSSRLQIIKKEVKAYEAKRNRMLDEEDEDFMFLS